MGRKHRKERAEIKRQYRQLFITWVHPEPGISKAGYRRAVVYDSIERRITRPPPPSITFERIYTPTLPLLGFLTKEAYGEPSSELICGKQPLTTF